MSGWPYHQELKWTRPLKGGRQNDQPILQMEIEAQTGTDEARVEKYNETCIPKSSSHALMKVLSLFLQGSTTVLGKLMTQRGTQRGTGTPLSICNSSCSRFSSCRPQFMCFCLNHNACRARWGCTLKTEHGSDQCPVLRTNVHPAPAPVSSSYCSSRLSEEMPGLSLKQGGLMRKPVGLAIIW